jgi:hypothetical protein
MLEQRLEEQEKRKEERMRANKSIDSNNPKN